MGTVFDQCEHGTVRIAMSNGESWEVRAWHRNDIAAHKRLDMPEWWTITHLPSGIGFANLGLFSESEKAVGALLEIARLRNSWRHVDYDEIIGMKETFVSIFKKHGARDDVYSCTPADQKYYRTDMNETGSAA